MPIRELFPGYFRPTEAEFKSMWNDGIVSVDANILLHVYRYSPPLRDALFLLLEKLGDRLWVSHRVIYEFSKNRKSVISGQEKAYDQACAVLDKISGTLKSDLPPRHPVIDIDEIKAAFFKLIEEKKASLIEQKTNHPKIPEADPSLARLSELLKEKIGEPRNDLESRIAEEGEKRFKAKIPPGFRDGSKDEDPLHKFGDLIIWRQVLDHVASMKCPYFIFATDDGSDDWWLKQDGKTIGPHPELVHEARREANTRVYFYSGDQFIRYGCKHFGIEADQKLIDEAETVRKEIRIRASETSAANKATELTLVNDGSVYGKLYVKPTDDTDSSGWEEIEFRGGHREKYMNDIPDDCDKSKSPWRCYYDRSIDPDGTYYVKARVRIKGKWTEWGQPLQITLPSKS